MNELEEKEAEKVKEFIGEIENRVNKMLEEIKEVRKVISK
jgi:hypothetical protein